MVAFRFSPTPFKKPSAFSGFQLDKNKFWCIFAPIYNAVMNSAPSLGGILSPQQKSDNLERLYIELPEIAKIPDLKDAVLAMHAIALEGADFSLYRVDQLSEGVRSKIKEIGCIVPGKFRSPEAFPLVGIRGIQRLGSVPDEEWGIWIPSPHEERLPLLLSLFFGKVEEMLSKTDGDKEVSLIILWACQIFLLLHPFYDGNGRVTRAFSSMLLLRKKKSPQFLELRANLLQSKDLNFLNGLYANFLVRLYVKYLEERGEDGINLLPEYIRHTLKGDEPTLEMMELLADKGNDLKKMERVKERQESIEALLELHLGHATIEDLRELFGEEELAFFSSKPGAFTFETP